MFKRTWHLQKDGGEKSKQTHVILIRSIPFSHEISMHLVLLVKHCAFSFKRFSYFFLLSKQSTRETELVKRNFILQHNVLSLFNPTGQLPTRPGIIDESYPDRSQKNHPDKMLDTLQAFGEKNWPPRETVTVKLNVSVHLSVISVNHLELPWHNQIHPPFLLSIPWFNPLDGNR